MMDFFHFANLARKGFIRFGEGKIKITGLRVLLFDVESLKALEEELEKVFGYNGCAHLLYRMSMYGGSRAARAHRRFANCGGDELIYYVAKMATGAGWGRIAVKKDGETYKMTVHDSPFVKRKKTAPTCHYLRGYSAGVVSYTYRARYDCIETECRSTGGKCCRFVIAKRGSLEKDRALRPHLNQISDFKFEF